MTEVITRQDEIELINTIYQELKQQDPYLSKHTMQLMIWEELENRLGMCFINYFSHGDGYQVWRDYPTKSSNMITEVTKNHFAKLTLERKKKLIESNKVARRWKKLKSNQEAGKSLDKNELENLVYGDKNSSSSDDKVSKPNISIGEGKPLLENTAEDKKKEGGGEEEEGVIDDPMFGGLTGRHTTILTDYAEIVKPMRALWKALTQKERMPYLSEDVINDYIKPSREFRTSLVLEVDEHMRTALYNSLVNLDSIIHDMLNIIDNADNKNKLE